MDENSYSHGTTPASFIAILGIAAAYFALARLSLLLAIPPGYASAIAPAAGVALASALLWGYRVWFGVWLGSFAANLWSVLNAGNAILSVSTVLAAVIATGAALQTVFGAYLIFRFVACPLNLYRLRDVVRFLLFGGPLSCLVNATISVICLSMAGAISAHDFWFSWLTWWVGDATGATLLTPVVLSLSVKHGEIWKLRRSSVTLPLCLILFLIVSLYVFVSNREEQRIEDEFKLKAELIASQIKEEWNASLDAVYSEVGFLAASGQVDRDKFRVFARYWLTRHHGIQALEWIPKVQHAERSGYEEAARRDGYPDFRITERTKQGMMVERTPQPEYFPVYYVEPYEGNEIALGFDLSSNKNRMSALNQALMTGKPVGTSRITLVQEKANQYGFLVFIPVYNGKISNPGEQELREALRGFALGVFRIGDAMHVVVGQTGTQGIQIQLTDLTAEQGEQLLYDSMSTTPASDHAKTASRSVTSVAPWLATSLEIAERRWQLFFSPAADYMAEHRSIQAWSVLAGGLFFAAGACAFLLVVTGRTSRIEVLVRERTDALEMEIAERRQTEKALQESETRYRLLAENATDVIWTVGMDMRLTYVSPSVMRLLGFTVEEAMARTMKQSYTSAAFEKAMQIFAEEMAIESAGGGHPTRSQMLELELVRKDGNTVLVEANFCFLRDPTGKGLGLLAIVRDITERKLAEESLRAALQEKEVLLREVHHRVKNNMQVISSLLSLQAERVEDEQVRQALLESQQRIVAMAMIHEALYSGQDLAAIDLSAYLKSLVSHLQGVYSSQADVRITLELDKVELGIDQAVPCGLIINELITNSFKHAFPRGSKGTIQIKIYRVNEEEMALEVSDNGVGLTSDLDLGDPSSLGLRLVQGLLKHQLKGSLDVAIEGGTAFTLRWPLPGGKGGSA
jgi:PAS domain S-box-containing protein